MHYVYGSLVPLYSVPRSSQFSSSFGFENCLHLGVDYVREQISYFGAKGTRLYYSGTFLHRSSSIYFHRLTSNHLGYFWLKERFTVPIFFKAIQLVKQCQALKNLLLIFKNSLLVQNSILWRLRLKLAYPGYRLNSDLDAVFSGRTRRMWGVIGRE